MTKKTKRIAKEVEPQGEHQVFEPPPIARSISNKEREKRVPEWSQHVWKPYSHYLCTLVVFNFITNGLIEFSQKLMSAKPTWIKDLSIQEVFEEFWTIGFGICYQDLTILIRVSGIHPMDDPNLSPSWPTIHVCWMPKHLAYVPPHLLLLL